MVGLVPIWCPDIAEVTSKQGSSSVNEQRCSVGLLRHQQYLHLGPVDTFITVMTCSPLLLACFVCYSVGCSGLVVSSGHSATHIIPIYQGQPVWHATTRSAVCGATATEHLQKLLLLKYPFNQTALSTPACQALKERYCYCALDYSQELKSIRQNPEAKCEDM